MVNRTKLLLHCLKSLSQGRVYIVRSKHLFRVLCPSPGRFRAGRVNHAHADVVYLLGYHFLSGHHQKSLQDRLCQGAYWQPYCCNILMNYCRLEENTQAIAINYVETLNILQHLYISGKEMKTQQ